MTMFNAPEVMLIRNWSDVRELEKTAEAVRSKYVEIFDQVLQAVRNNHRELNLPWMKSLLRFQSVGIGKESWRFKPDAWPSGFWIEDILLDNLLAQDQAGPTKWVCIHDPRADLHEAEDRLREHATKTLGREELRLIEFGTDKRTAFFGLRLKEPRDQLVELLIKDEARGFIRKMIDNFEWMTKFTSVLDEFHSPARKRRK